MENEPKKISFGFKNLLKKPNIIVKQPVLEEKKTEIIEYIEEKSIKVVGADDTPKGPLVIPMKESNKTKLTNLIDIVQNNFQEPDIPLPPKTENGNIEPVNSENLSLEEQAARELLNDTKNVKVEEDVKRVIDVPKNVEKVTFEGEKESTIDDYEDIPVQEFGKAMLRGMGWKDGHGIGKNEQLVKMTQPLQRPKGMGLGADKMAKQDINDKPAVDKDGNALKCVKGAYVKIIAGYHKGNYGQIIGLDDESGRFIIKTALNNLNVSLNEFLVSPVTKDEYTKNSKVINNAKYEEYIQKKENEEKKKLEKIKNERNSTDDEDRKRTENKKEKIKERKSYSSEDEPRSRKDKYEEKRKTIKRERKYSDSDDDYKYNDKYSKDVKKERSDKYDKRTVKKEESDYEEKKSRKQSTSKYDSDEETRDRKQRDKYKNKSKISSDSEVEERKSRKYEKSSSKYNSDEETRDRKQRDKYKSKSKYSSDTEEEEKKKSKKKSSKYDSDSDDYEQKKKHKKKKSKKYSSDEDSDDKYKKKSKKKEKKYESDSEDEKHKKKKKDKYKDKRDRSKHDRK